MPVWDVGLGLTLPSCLSKVGRNNERNQEPILPYAGSAQTVSRGVKKSISCPFSYHLNPTMIIRIAWAGLLTAALLGGGCVSYSTVWFAAPERTTVYLPNRKVPVVMPVTVKLEQTDDPKNVNVDEGGRPVRVVLPDGTKLKGFLYVYKSKLDQAEKLVVMTFELTAERIEKLKQGQAVTVVGLSSKEKPIYKINLGMDLE